MKIFSGIVGGLILGLIGAFLIVTAFAELKNASTTLGFIALFIMWGVGILIAIQAPSTAKTWRRILITAGIMSFLLPLAGVFYSTTYTAITANKGGEYSGAATAGAMVGGGLIIGFLGIIGFFMGLIFLIIGLLTGRDKQVVYIKIPTRNKTEIMQDDSLYPEDSVQLRPAAIKSFENTLNDKELTDCLECGIPLVPGDNHCRHCGKALIIKDTLTPVEQNGLKLTISGLVVIIILAGVFLANQYGMFPHEKTAAEVYKEKYMNSSYTDSDIAPITTENTDYWNNIKKRNAASSKTIDYKTVRSWSIPNGGYGKAIIINNQNRNYDDMKALGEILKRDFANDRNAFIFIFDDTRAAVLQENATNLNKDDGDFYDQHSIGMYTKNVNTGYHKMQIFLDGNNGSVSEVNY
ncbi:MAG: hypothetical protein PHW04_04825 [Candidatus Wallbacteria bacterium]|nr:hypothetical protein [Candidatus Wallbacteria bacterium]